MLQNISEDFLQYIWKFKYFKTEEIYTIQNQLIQIHHPGFQNFDAGPDFSNAQICIEGTRWYGNVELHLKSSDWIKHKHSNDPSYNSIVLHVVYHHDCELSELSNNKIPTLELKNLIDQNVIENHLTLYQSRHSILCAPFIKKLPSIVITSMMEKVAIERLQNKTLEIERIFKFTNQNWEECFYILLSKYFATNTNADPFERLARSISLSIILKIKDHPRKVEALLFGQSGLLPKTSNDNYITTLIKEYKFQKHKLALKPLNKAIWKFARMRPNSFPTLNIARLASLLVANDSLFSRIKHFENVEDLIKIFKLELHPFWNTHYHFEKESSFKKKMLGSQLIHSIIINAIVPMLFFFGMKTDQLVYKEKAIALLINLNPEKNKIIKSWHEIGLIAKTALDSQALLSLKKSYCDLKRCVDCNIGHHSIKKH